MRTPTLIVLPWMIGLSAGAAPVRTQATAPTAPAATTPSEARSEPAIELHGRFSIGEQGQRRLELWGSPRERGFAHGYLLAPEILQTFDRDFAVVMGKRVKQYAVLSLTVLPRFRFSKAENQTLRGIMAGIKARLPAKKDRKIAILNRTVNLTDLKALNTFGDWVALGCSTIALWGDHSPDGQPVIARNFDFRSFHALMENGHVVVNAPYRNEDGETVRGHVTIGHPGCIGSITGMNDAGVWASIHDVYKQPGMKHAMRPNIPRLCAQRRLLEQLGPGTVGADTEKRLREWPTLFGNNFMVVDPKPKSGQPYAATFEYDNREQGEGGVTMRILDRAGAESAEWLACTNHHRVRGVIKGQKFSCSRYRRLAAFADREAKALDVPALFALANEAAVPRADRVVAPVGMEGRRHGTLHQVVGLTGRRELHVKLLTKGFGNIRDQKPVRYRIGDLLGALPTEPVKTAVQAADAKSGG